GGETAPRGRAGAGRETTANGEVPAAACPLSPIAPGLAAGPRPGGAVLRTRFTGGAVARVFDGVADGALALPVLRMAECGHEKRMESSPDQHRARQSSVLQGPPHAPGVGAVA